MDRLLSFARERAKAIDSLISETAGSLKVDCGKGCTYCCYGVPLWVRGVEIYLLLDALNGLPVRQRKEIASRLKGYERDYRESASQQGYLVEGPLPEDQLDVDKLGLVCGLGMNEIPCPFLSEDGLCRIYDARPSMCRLTLFYDREVCRKDWENPIAFIWKNEIEPFQRKVKEEFLARWRWRVRELAKEYPDLDVESLEGTCYFVPRHLSFDPVKRVFKLRGMGQGNP